MSIEVERVETVTFDSFSTIVDVHTATEKLESYVEDPEHMSWLWRTYVSHYRPLCNFLGYMSHHEINRAALKYVFGKFDVKASDEELDEIAQVYYEMEPFEDVREGMERLRDAGYDLYVLSNGDHDVLDAMVSNAGIGDLLDGLISADEIRIYKPHVRLYKYTAQQTGTPPDNIVHASALWGDVLGGMYAGNQGVWVNRQGEPRGIQPFDGEPDQVVSDFLELAEELGA